MAQKSATLHSAVVFYFFEKLIVVVCETFGVFL